jgi:hypothetical protein
MPENQIRLEPRGRPISLRFALDFTRDAISVCRRSEKISQGMC